MIKKHKKMIALLVAFTFLSLLQISFMPLRAEQSPDQVGTAIKSPEQTPNFIEEDGNSSHQTKKKSILPIILIGVGVAAVAAVLFLVVLKTKYDITGFWTVTLNSESGSAFTVSFAGDTGNKNSGDTYYYGWHGRYNVNGKDVTWTLTYYAPNPADTETLTFIGKFDSKTKITGNVTSNKGGNDTFTAIKKSTTT
jgi:hypothetical protein